MTGQMLELQVILLITAVIETYSIPQSPCPDIYQYNYDPYEKAWSGSISAPAVPSAMEIKMKVIMTINAILPSQYSGKLELEEDKKIVWRRIRFGDLNPIKYRVHFPLQIPLPEMEYIIYNGNVICKGNSGAFRTRIALEHKFYPITKTMITPTANNPQAPSGYFGSPVEVEPPQPRPVSLVPSSENGLPWELFTPKTSTDRPTKSETPMFPLPVQPEILMDNEEYACGKSITSTIPLVVNGSPTKRNEWPWLAAIFLWSQWGLNFTCGGSLVGPRAVVTAAHCMKFRSRPEARTDSLVVFLGKHNLKQWSDTGFQAREVESVHLHPEYDSEEIKNDIAVLILKEKVQYNQYVQPICLWRFTSDLQPFVGQFGTVVGWGQDEKSDGPTEEPRAVSMPIVSQEQCLRSSKEYIYFTSNTTFCAGHQNGAGPCNGDSGGGFMMPFKENEDVRWYLKGVVSTALLNRETRRCDTSKYFIFTDVAKFSDWVSSFVRA